MVRRGLLERMLAKTKMGPWGIRNTMHRRHVRCACTVRVVYLLPIIDFFHVRSWLIHELEPFVASSNIPHHITQVVTQHLLLVIAINEDDNLVNDDEQRNSTIKSKTRNHSITNANIFSSLSLFRFIAGEWWRVGSSKFCL